MSENCCAVMIPSGRTTRIFLPNTGGGGGGGSSGATGSFTGPLNFSLTQGDRVALVVYGSFPDLLDTFTGSIRASLMLSAPV